MTPTCGLCKYGVLLPNDLSKRACHGHPPLGFPVPQGIQTVWPIVNTTDVACSLYDTHMVMAPPKATMPGESSGDGQ
jgi:hypothetical protein